MTIERIYVSGWRGDARFTRCCVASIRQWYPDIPITLIKDFAGGDYDTRDIEALWHVEVLQGPRRRFGPAGKLEPLFGTSGERFLSIDSDIVFLGPVLDVLDAFTEDMVVNGWEGREDVDRYFYDVDRLRALAPDLRGDEQVFNAGQFVATAGVVQRSEFEGLVAFDEPPRLLRPDIFRNVDQGTLSFVVLRKVARGEMTVRWHSFMWWPGEPTVDLDMARIRGAGDGYPALLHWAGFSTRQWRSLPWHDVLDHFETLFYSRVPYGRARRLERAARDVGRHAAGRARRAIGRPIRRVHAGLSAVARRLWRGRSRPA